MTGWPCFSDPQNTGRVGAHLVGLKVHKELRWVFRETSSSDIGVDGEIETRYDDTTSHGRILSVQIKCGPSYLRERSGDSFIFRASHPELRYWLAHTTPVLIVLCDPETEQCWWAAVDLQNITLHEHGWSMAVPYANCLDVANREKLERLAARFQKKDLVDLLFRDWLGWSFEHRLQLASQLTIPRDYHWLSLLGRLGDSFIMMDYVVADLDGFRDADVGEMLRWAAENHRTFGYERFLLGFVSEYPGHLHDLPDPKPIPGVLIEYVPLLLQVRFEPALTEIGKGAEWIEFYENGETIGAHAEFVQRNTKRSGP